MEVSLASREEDPDLTHAPAMGLFRRLSRQAHTHARALQCAPYLVGGWRLPCGTAATLAPRPKDGTRRSPTGGEAHQLPASVCLAAAPPHTPASAPPRFLVEPCSPPLPPDPAGPQYTPSPGSLRLHAAPRMSHEFAGSDAPRHPSPTPSHDPHAHRPQRLPGHAAPPSATTLSPFLGHHAPFTPPSAVPVPPDMVPPTGRLPRWPGAAPAWTSPEFTNNQRPDPPQEGGGGGPRPAQPTVAALPRGGFTSEDREEIRQLQASYDGSQEDGATPLDECGPRLEEVGRLYTAFVEKRAKFLLKTPRFGTVAAADRARLLHVAVAMSTYYMGALHMDLSDFTWRWKHRGNGGSGASRTTVSGTGAVLSVSSARQLLTHQQFVHVMKFYTTYREVLADDTVTILMQVMSMFYPEAGLEAPRPVEEARLHYLGLLSRYLATTHGPIEGARRLATLLTSQQEARQLVDVLRTVDLTTPREPRLALGTSRTMLADRIQLVCAAARRGRQARDAGVGIPSSPTHGPSTPPSHPHDTQSPPTPGPCTHSPLTPPAQSSGTAVGLEEVGRLLSRLASCEDPATLAEARRILPAPLLHRFLQLLQDAPPPRHTAHTTPPPQCTPPSPSPSPPSPHLHRSVSLTAGEPPPPPSPVPPHHLHLPPAVHPELAAE